MKAYNNLFDKICAFPNLYLAFCKARKAKRFCYNVLKFNYNLERNLLEIEEDLVNQSYVHGGYRCFYVCDPKRRLIAASTFRDRVVHHGLCNIIEPIFDKTFIYDSYACRKNKGTHLALGRLTQFLRREFSKRKGINSLYVLKCDVSKYFETVDHGVLLGLIENKIKDKQALWLVKEIIDSNENNKGIPIGNLTSQLFANIYLNQLDHFVKEELGVKYYIRYMDDFLILDESKARLHQIKESIREFLEKLRLNLHPRKTTVYPARAGIDFLGYIVWPQYRRLRGANVKRFKKRLKCFKDAYGRGEAEIEDISCFLRSWIAHANHADTWRLRYGLFKDTVFKRVEG